ncbi:Uncharacterized protein SCF082_LOCUS48014 [Durusdinium trenchii]|uniref:Uncharacterized protein n=1 Tax=Durusdinium trenchii TaxID=1381693 RepID=A0ABP0RPZ7_9DINO
MRFLLVALSALLVHAQEKLVGEFGQEVLGCRCAGGKTTHGNCGYHFHFMSNEEKPWCRTKFGCGHYSIKGPWVYCDEQSVERRRADDGKLYNALQFKKFFDKEGKDKWTNAAKYIETRVARNGKAYTAGEFRDYYIDYLGEALAIELEKMIIETKRYYLTFAFLVLLLVTFLQINSWAMSSLDESPSGRYPEGKLPCFLPEVRTFYDIVKYDYIGFHFLSDVCGLLGFAILSMRLGYFVKKNADVKLKVKQGEQAFPDDDEGHEVQVATDGMPWKLADRMDWVVIILGTPLIFIAQGQERFAHGAYMEEMSRLEIAAGRIGAIDWQTGYMRIVAYTAVQGVYAFVFIGVLRTIFDIAVTYISEMPKYHEQETYRTDALFTLDKFDHRKGT